MAQSNHQLCMHANIGEVISREILNPWPLSYPEHVLRPSHTTTEIAKKVVIFHTHYNFSSQLQQFCIWTKIFTTIFSEKSL